MLLSEDSEVLTDEGEFPISFLNEKSFRVWNGNSWQVIPPAKKAESSKKIVRSHFISYFTYPGIRSKVGIPFKTHLTGNFNLRTKGGIIRNILDIDNLTYMEKYYNNDESFFQTFVTGENLVIKDKITLYEVKEKTEFIVNGIMVCNY